MVDDSIIKRWLVIAIIVLVFVLSLLILRPILVAIGIGILFAYIFSPFFKLINEYIKNKTLAAFLLLLTIAVVVLVPLIYWTPTIIRQTFDIYQNFQNYNFSQIFESYVGKDLAPSLALNFDNIVSKFFSSFLGQFTSLLINLPTILLNFAVFLFTFFYVIRDSDKLKDYLSSLSPFSEKTEEKFLNELRGITNAIVFGQVIIGVVQGLALGIGFFILGVPKTIILTFIAIIICMIPFLGSGLVWIPVSFFLLASGQTYSGIFLLLYGGLFVSSLDNIIRPIILSRKSSTLPIPVSIIGTIGGLFVFGIAGLILGPLILAYAMIIIEFYQQGKLGELFK